MSDISDQTQRLQALDATQSFIVQAPAGSGKTELLTQRFLLLLGHVDQPEEIVAITFTRKAAAEMRDRIISALEAATGPRPDEPHRQRTWDLAHAALEQDARRQWQLRQNPSRLRIQTFDSLSASIARQLPLLSEMGAATQTREDASPLYQEAARATLRRLQDRELSVPLASILRHLDNQLGQLEQLLIQMLGKRDQWLPHLFEGQDAGVLEKALATLIETQLEQLNETIPAATMTELVRLAGFAADHLPPEKQADPRFADLMLWKERHFRPGSTWDDLPLWLGLSRVVLTNTGSLRKQVTKNDGFPADQKQAKADVLQLIGEIGHTGSLTEQLGMLGKLPLERFSDSQRELLDALRLVLLNAAAQLQLVFQDHAEIDFIEVHLRALQALGAPDDPSDLALLLDYRIQHLLVDEFQDTSIGQQRLLEQLTAGWQPGDGRTLFVVGDPMQSIYRFRKAEVSLFLQAAQHGLPNVPLTPVRLEMNFRSQGGIVEWVNDHFAGLFPGQTDVTLGAMPYAPSVPYHPPSSGDAVTVHPLAARDDEYEAAGIVTLIEQSLARDDAGSIAVLARARRHLHVIATALQQAGIRYQAVKVDPLVERPTVQDLHSLCRALLHPADRLSWLSLLRSPLVGVTLPDLALLCEDSHDLPLWQLIQNDQRLHTLSNDGQRRIRRMRDILATEIPTRYAQPLRDRVESIWLSLGGAVVGDPEDARAYLELLEQQEQQHNIADFSQLEESLAQLFAPPDSEADGRVQLMTMHQAKGLEFDTVILPGLGKMAGRDQRELLYWLELPEESAEAALLMAPVKGTHQEREPISEFIRWFNQRKQELEDLRLLYVAATRARKRLHLFAHARFNSRGEAAPESGSLLQRLWPALETHFAALTAPEASHQETVWQITQRPEQRIAADWRIPLADTGSVPKAPPPANANPIDFDWAGDTARHVGTLTHRYLEHIGNEGIEAWTTERLLMQREAIHIGLANLGVSPENQDTACDKVMRALQLTIEHEQGRWILSAHGQAACELPLSMLGDDGLPHQYVIDRTFVADGIRWIVDYKTGDHQGPDTAAFLDREQARYREQLETYARILQQMEDLPIKLALYFPLLQAWRVWDAGTIKAPAAE